MLPKPKAKRKTKAQQAAEAKARKFQPWKICVKTLDPREREQHLRENMGQEAREAEARQSSLLHQLTGTGYTQFRLVSLSAPSKFALVNTLFASLYLIITSSLLLDFDYLIYDCVSKVLCAEEIKGIVYEFLVRTYNCGFDVGMCISDGASPNRLFCKEWFTLSNPHDEDDDIGLATYMLHPSSGLPVYYVPDPSHVLKKLVASLDNDNHFIFKANPDTPDVDPTVQLTLRRLHDLFLSFEGQNCPRSFRFNRNHFIKTPFEKMRVSPCRDVLGAPMRAMLLEADRREGLFAVSEEKDMRFWSYKNISMLTKPMLEIVDHVSSVFDILDRRKQPGLSARRTHVEELDKFKSAAIW